MPVTCRPDRQVLVDRNIALYRRHLAEGKTSQKCFDETVAILEGLRDPYIPVQIVRPGECNLNSDLNVIFDITEEEVQTL